LQFNFVLSSKILYKGINSYALLAASKGSIPNRTRDFVAEIEKKIDFKFISDGYGDLQSTFGPEDIFHYIYAIFHSPTYRNRYEAFLKMDFPKVPLTSNVDRFRKLWAFGKELVSLHLLESPKLEVSKFFTRYPVVGDDFIENSSKDCS
jgi:predicted helicase